MFGDKKPSVKAKSKTDDYTEIRNKLNISSEAPKEKIAFELNKLKDKRLWSIYGITEKDFKKFGVTL
tara:strand:+ start:356 stop:556 length:201 start_codon:yes stop_codon:yes gene_type:complete